MTKFLPPKCDFTVEGDHIVTDGSVKGKITGTKLAPILGASHFSSPFQVACDLLGLGREDISSKSAVQFGIAKESDIVAYLSEAYADVGQFMGSDEALGRKNGSPTDDNSDFEHDLYGGHIDGAVIEPDGTACILEIKTGDPQYWVVDGKMQIPENYRMQVALYDRFVMGGVGHAYIALGARESNDSIANWTPNADNVFLFPVTFTEEEVDGWLAQAEEWYAKYIAEGVTPDYDRENKGDVRMMTHLIAVASGDMQSQVDELCELSARMAVLEDQLAPLKKRADELKDEIRDNFSVNGKDCQSASDGLWKVVVSVRNTPSLDKVLMAKDGIDIKKYTVVKSTYAVSIKKE